MLTVLACIIVADFLTGLVHWIEDTYGLPSWPILGALIVEPNIEHHLDPLALCDSPVWLRNYQAGIPACLFSAGVFGWLGLDGWPVVLTVVFAAMGNEVHAWSHAGKSNPWPIRFLQDAGLVQTPQHHAQHHRPPYNRRFCTLTNFTNAVLDLVGFWPALEAVLSLAWITPKRLSAERLGV